ncbi:ATP-binding protein [Candidatus Pacearchaeota archaeon]|nr:ATP-binding protein [Candidatus Pacearchaeota archaeon]
MHKVFEMLKGSAGKIQGSLSTIVKIILIFSIFYATYFHLWHIMIANIFLLFLLFIPYFLRRNYEVQIPAEFEFIFLIFIIVSFFLGGIRGVIIQTFFGIAVGFIGFTIMLLLFSHSKFKANYLLIMLFSFSFSVTFGLVAELTKYYLKVYLDYGEVLSDYPYTMMNLTLVALGAFISSCFGYLYMKGYRLKAFSFFVNKFKNKNPNFFIKRTDSPEEILNLIKKGEDEKLEFKSTLRMNLHTGEKDRKVENAVLKTVAAFLNSEGGNLLIGVSDNREILGIEKDEFENNDMFNRHFTNLIKERIGNEYLPFMSFELVKIEEKYVLKVECMKSNKPVFLKCDGVEEFYIRVGASTILLSGSKIIDYLKNSGKFINSF